MNMELDYCERCIQATNHGCLKCSGKEAQKDVIAQVDELVKQVTVYKGIISKSDAWRMSGDVLCDYIEEEVKKHFEKELQKLRESLE